MTDQTDQTLKIWRTVPFSYETGQDCLMSLADHVLRVTGVDHGAMWRGSYHSEQEAFAHVMKWGGPLNMVDASCLPRTDAPGRGDIVIANVGGKPIGGLHTGHSIAFRLPHGVGDINSKLVKIIAAWRVS